MSRLFLALLLECCHNLFHVVGNCCEGNSFSENSTALFAALHSFSKLPKWHILLPDDLAESGRRVRCQWHSLGGSEREGNMAEAF